MIRLAGCLLAVAALVHAQGGAVDGSVMNTATGRGVKGAYVVVRGLAAEGPAETYICQTDAEGRFSVADVAPGRYQVETSRPGFQAKAPERAATAANFPQITVQAGQRTSGVGLRLTPLGAIGGKILDDRGNGVPNATVEAIQFRYQAGKRVPRPVQRMQTDDRGEYFFSDLPPGRYYLRAFNMNSDPPLSGGVENRGPARTRIYAPGYFGGAREASRAVMLEVAPAAELARIDIAVHRVSIYSIRGLAPAGSQQSIVRPAGEPGFAYAQRMYGESRENFEIDGIPPGSYPLRVSKPQQPGVFAFRRVEVRDQDVEGLDLRNSTGRQVSGSVQLGDSVAVPRESLKVVLQPEDPGAGTDAESAVNADGSFTLTGQPDAYYVRVQAPAGSYLKSVRVGDRDAPDHRVNPGNDSGRLTLVLGADTGKVEGVAEDASGAPAGLVRITLIPDQSLPYWPDLLQSGTTDASGRFSFSGVPPGAYRLYAWTDVEAGAPEDAEFRKPFDNMAAAVQVPPRGTISVKLKAIDAGGK